MHRAATNLYCTGSKRLLHASFLVSLPCEASMLGAFFCARHSYSLHHFPPHSSSSLSRLGTSSSSSCILIVILILVVIFIIGIIILIIILTIASTIVFSRIIIRVTYMPWKLHLRSRKMWLVDPDRRQPRKPAFGIHPFLIYCHKISQLHTSRSPPCSQIGRRQAGSMPFAQSHQVIPFRQECYICGLQFWTEGIVTQRALHQKVHTFLRSYWALFEVRFSFGVMWKLAWRKNTTKYRGYASKKS